MNLQKRTSILVTLGLGVFSGILGVLVGLVAEGHSHFLDPERLLFCVAILSVPMGIILLVQSVVIIFVKKEELIWVVGALVCFLQFAVGLMIVSLSRF